MYTSVHVTVTYATDTRDWRECVNHDVIWRRIASTTTSCYVIFDAIASIARICLMPPDLRRDVILLSCNTPLIRIDTVPRLLLLHAAAANASDDDDDNGDWTVSSISIGHPARSHAALLGQSTVPTDNGCRRVWRADCQKLPEPSCRGNFGSSKGAVCDGDEHVTILRFVYFRCYTKRCGRKLQRNTTAVHSKTCRYARDISCSVTAPLFLTTLQINR